MNWNEVPVILENISVYNDRDMIIDGINLEIIPGKVTVLMGNSGCGKSTVLKAAAGLIPISKGSVKYGESKLYKLNQKDFARIQTHTGFMFQDGALWANKSIYENLVLPLAISDSKLDREWIDERVKKALQSFHMEEEAMNRPAALSAGERKMISFLRATISDPQILFMDEPTTYIDRKSVILLIRRMFQFKKEGKTILMVTHDLNLARRLADYFVFLDEGKIVLKDTIRNAMDSEDPLFRAFIEDQSLEEK